MRIGWRCDVAARAGNGGLDVAARALSCDADEAIEPSDAGRVDAALARCCGTSATT